jgi:hypothetical protein
VRDQLNHLCKFALLILLATCGLSLASPASAVTLNIIGNTGTEGNFIGDGGTGGTASAITTPNGDPSNTANATGGLEATPS